MIEAHDLSVDLGGRRILRGVDFSARSGTLNAIVGPNGSGKTTLLRRLTGDLAGAGLVRMGGRVVDGHDLRQLARRRGVLAQSVQVGFSFTLREIVQIGHAAGQMGHVPDIVDKAIAEVDLTHRADTPMQALSGGEQARAHLARVRAQIWQPVFEGTPSWLFVDEPVAALDIGHQLQVMAILRRFADRGGGVIAVMHDLNLTAMHADRVVLMEAGQVAAQGRPEDVLTDRRLSHAYGCAIRTNHAPASGVWLVPQAGATDQGMAGQAIAGQGGLRHG